MITDLGMAIPCFKEGKMTFNTAGEKRKFYRNMRYNRSARQIGVASLSLCMLLAPIGLVLIVAFALLGGFNHLQHPTALGMIAMAAVPVLPNIKALRHKDTELKTEGLAIISAAKERSLTPEERTRLDSITAERKTVGEDLVRVEAFLEEQRTAPPAAGSAGRSEPIIDPKFGFKNLGEQLIAIKKAAASQGRSVDERLTKFVNAAQGANESVDPEGGFLIAPDFSPGLLQRTYDVGEVAKLCYQQPMSSNRLIMNAVDEDSRVNGSRWGGLVASWIGEAGTYAGTKPKFRQVQITAKKLVGLVYATEEQLEDGPALASYVLKAVPDEFAFQIDDAVINGDGAAKPLGILQGRSFVSVAEESAQQAATIVTANILKMHKRLFGPSRKNAVWFINQDIEDQLYSLTLGSGTAVQLLYTPPGVNGNASGYGILLGKPVIPIEQAQTLGTQGDIILADMNQYILGQRGGMRADSSIHVAFLTGEQAFRFMLRVDGQPWWKVPLTPKNGSNTQSPFVVLDTRS
jgi:HK97 family phage major capsid protein